MGHHSNITKQKLKKGLWSPEEDEKLYNYITLYGVGCWSSVPKLAGLQRCGKSCRLRWINYLRPDLKRGMFSQEEENLIISLHQSLGNRWAQIAAQLPGRTDNEIKNLWNSTLKKKLMKQGINPKTHKPLDTQPQSNNIDNYSNALAFENSSEEHNIPQGTVKLEQQSYAPYIPTEGNIITSVFSNALSSPVNSNYSILEHSPDACQSYQNILDEIPLESRNWFSESLVYSEGNECFTNSTSDSNIINNISKNRSFSWENEELFTYPSNNNGLIKSEESYDQPSLWEEVKLAASSFDMF